MSAHGFPFSYGDTADSASHTSVGSEIPRRPWVFSKQYSWTFVLSQDNEIILGTKSCEALGDDVVKFIVAAVNAYSSDT